MKKAVSLLASFALAFSLVGAPVMSFADEAPDAAADSVATVETAAVTQASESSDDSLLDYLEELFTGQDFTSVAAPTTGSVEVRLTTLLVDPVLTGGVKASLLKDGTTVKSADFTKKQEEGRPEHGYVAKLDDIAPGTYTLKVTGAGFVPYIHDGIQVAAASRDILTILDQYSDVRAPEDGMLIDVRAGRGLFPYGNLNDDDRIDEADAKLLLQAIARVRAGEALSDAETAKYGMNLVVAAEASAVQAKEGVEDEAAVEPQDAAEGAPEPQADEPGAPEPSDEAAQQPATAEQAARTQEPDLQALAELFGEDWSDHEVIYINPFGSTDINPNINFTFGANANDGDPKIESSARPEFREENAIEEVTDAATAIDQSELSLNEFKREAATALMPVGLNAFQKLATMRGARAATGTISHASETSHMQAVGSADTKIEVAEGKSLTDVLFGSNDDVVKLSPVGDESISEAHPVQVTINAQGVPTNAVTISVPADSPHAPTAGEVIIQSNDDPSDLIVCPFVTEQVGGRISSAVSLRSSSAAQARLSFFDGGQANTVEPEASVDKANGLITINLGRQVPVKTITIRVTDTSSKKLAEIAKVEFLNDFQNYIPAPDLSIPSNLKVISAKDKAISLAWDAQRNVTGYEVEVSSGGSSSVVFAATNSLTVKSMGGKELTNYRTYTLRVRSVNGDWSSPWSATVTATPEASGLPKKPAAPRVSAGYDFITVSWSAAEDAQTHNVWYRKKGDTSFTLAAERTDKTRLDINDLLRETTYDVYVEGVNKNGTGPRSDVVSATTTPDKVKVPWYGLYNREVINKERGTSFAPVIEKVEGDNGSSATNDPATMVDGDYNTYYSGAKGGYYHGGTVTFKQPFSMDTIVLTGYQGQSLNIYDMVVQAWDANGQPIKPSGGNIRFSTMTYDAKTRTVMIRTEKLEGVKKIRVAYQRAVGNQWSASTIAELAFYNTTLYSDVMAVWADDEHTQLVAGTTEAQLLELQKRVNTPDVIATPTGNVSELHPSRALLLAELENALIVCRNGDLRAPIKVDGKLNVSSPHVKRGVGGLNGWQPLGVAAAAGDEISVYVGRKGETAGDVPLAIYVVQNHPDISNGFAVRLDSATNKVKIGLNSFRIPENITSLNTEQGGSLYVEYGTSRGNNEQYTVRVSGGTQIPLLDVHNVTDAEARMELIRAYVQNVKDYDPAAQHRTKQHVTNADSADYGAQNCIANATDIVLADMMYSIPVSQVASAIGVSASSTPQQVEAAAQKLAKSLTAMDDMMKLFYQHKGFVKDGSAAAKYGSNNAWPTLRQNIRYVRCSGSTFMYAAGNHIGVQWGSVGGLVSMPGVTADANGKYEEGKFFGWGIAHEIGHEINNGAYTYAEVTNNYYAQLAQATDDPTNPKTRWGTYDGIYKRVASGAKGMSLGKTGIAMYWQLHLAYDNDYNYKTYATAAEQLDNLVFARMDAYARNASLAPKAEGAKSHAFTLEGANKDNALMRLACAATQKDLLDFFEAWGLTPDEETRAYATQWPKEERAIQYQTDALRLFRLGDFSQLTQYGVSSNNIGDAAKKARVTANLSYEPIAGRPNTTEQQSITVTLSGATVSNDILGYEVLRNGKVVGFLRANSFEGCEGVFTGDTATFVDTINTVNNRVFTYQVRAVDKLLHRGEAVDAGAVKVSHKNSLSKDKWTATTNMASGNVPANDGHSVTGTVEGETVVYDAEDYADDNEVEVTVEHPVAQAIDGKATTSFTGTVAGGGDARITIDFGETLSVVGVRLKGAPAGLSYTIETSADGEEWKVIPVEAADDGTLYFTRESDAYLYGHDAAALRLTAQGQSGLTVSEIDVLGPQGDDAEFLENGIGVLDKTEKLGTTESNQEATIPAGSLVFVGTYKGNPAYNALLLYDQNNNILGGYDEQGVLCAKEVIFAPELGEDALLGDVEKGYWVYYIEPQHLPSNWKSLITSVRAQLYRVDDAHTLEGQRLVADTLPKAIPSDLSKIDLEFGQVKGSQQNESSVVNAEEQLQNNAEIPIDAAAPVPSQNAPTVSEAASAPPTNERSYESIIFDDEAATPSESSNAAAGTPIYNTRSLAGEPIYDDATPLASTGADHASLAKKTLRARYDALTERLERLDAAQPMAQG